MKKGKLFIISGPSGSGKTTLYRKLLSSKRLQGKIVKSVSVTTRPRREKEKHGRDYFFVSRERFLYKKRAKHFLESANVFGYYYGTPKKNVLDLMRKGKNVLLCIDVQGARAVNKIFPKAVKIFIKTSSMAALKKRLGKRGTENKGTFQNRIRAARKELKEAKKYDHVVTNDALARAYRQIERIVVEALGG